MIVDAVGTSSPAGRRGASHGVLRVVGELASGRHRDVEPGLLEDLGGLRDRQPEHHGHLDRATLEELRQHVGEADATGISMPLSVFCIVLLPDRAGNRATEDVAAVELPLIVTFSSGYWLLSGLPTQTAAARFGVKPANHTAMLSFVVPVLPAAGRSSATLRAGAAPGHHALQRVSRSVGTGLRSTTCSHVGLRGEQHAAVAVAHLGDRVRPRSAGRGRPAWRRPRPCAAATPRRRRA